MHLYGMYYIKCGYTSINSYNRTLFTVSPLIVYMYQNHIIHTIVSLIVSGKTIYVVSLFQLYYIRIQSSSSNNM